MSSIVNRTAALPLGDDQTLADARRVYFESNGFDPDGGYGRRWFYVGWKRLALPLPNVPARVRAVRIHDLHHIATGYATDWPGEVEIGGWELAGGCRGYLAAWVLNLYSFAIGLVIAPRRLWAAFVAGRRCRTLYATGFEPALLEASLGDLRRRLGLPTADRAPSIRDRLAFSGMTLLALSQAALTVSPGLAVAWLALCG